MRSDTACRENTATVPFSQPPLYACMTMEDNRFSQRSCIFYPKKEKRRMEIPAHLQHTSRPLRGLERHVP